VIAFNALTGYRMDDVPTSSDDVPLGVSRLWTIGSPLEKFAFFFPAMTQLPPLAAYRFTKTFVAVRGDVAAPQWINFRNPLDAVSGRLRSFPGWSIENRRVWAGGLGRSHTIYERNTHVIDALADSLFDVRRQAAISKAARVRGFFEALAESLAVLAVLVLPVLAGAALVLVLALGLPWLIGTVVGVFASDAVEGRVKDWGALILGLPLLVTLFVLGPLSTSVDEHRVWRQP
jgi:hypothetical protein